MTNTLHIDGKQYTRVADGSRTASLCTLGKVPCKSVGGSWFVDVDELRLYKESLADKALEQESVDMAKDRYFVTPVTVLPPKKFLALKSGSAHHSRMISMPQALAGALVVVIMVTYGIVFFGPQPARYTFDAVEIEPQTLRVQVASALQSGEEIMDAIVTFIENRF